MRKRSPSGRKRSSFASRSRRKRADVLALERERDRLVDQRRGLGDRGFRGVGRQLRLDVGQRRRQRAHAGQGRLGQRVGEPAGSTASPGRDGDDAEVAAGDDLGAARLRQRRGDSGGDLLEPGAGDEDRVDDPRRRARVDELPHSAGETASARVPERLLGRRPVEPEHLARPDLVRLAADDDAHRRLQVRLTELDARERPVPVVRVARSHGGHGQPAHAGEHGDSDHPHASHASKVAAEAGLHSNP